MNADGLLPEDKKIRSSKYLNNLIQQDHRNIKSRTPEHEIHRLAGSIYRTVQMNPFATNFQVGFVNTLALDDPEPHKFAALSQQVKTLVS
jgi:transposase-like protein